MEQTIFDKRFHKHIFIRRLIIAIFTFVIPLIGVTLFDILSNESFNSASIILLIFYGIFTVGFIILSIVNINLDKKVTYKQEYISKGYKIGFIITKIASIVQFCIFQILYILLIIIGLFGMLIEKDFVYEVGNETNLEYKEVCDLHHFSMKYPYKLNEIEFNDHLLALDYVETDGESLHSTLRIRYKTTLTYNYAKENYLSSNAYLSTPLKGRGDNYVYPLTNFTLGNINYLVVENEDLSNMKFIGFNDNLNTIIILNGKELKYQNFGNELEVAKENFLDYIVNMFYIPYLEELPN